MPSGGDEADNLHVNMKQDPHAQDASSWEPKLHEVANLHKVAERVHLQPANEVSDRTIASALQAVQHVLPLCAFLLAVVCLLRD